MLKNQGSFGTYQGMLWKPRTNLISIKTRPYRDKPWLGTILAIFAVLAVLVVLAVTAVLAVLAVLALLA